jgi:GTP-binding protein
MKFIDETTVEVTAGKGGEGVVRFRREKFVPYGGPDGGDGGEGGSIVLIADDNRHTLLDLKFTPLLRAKDGQPGGGSRRSGKAGEDLVIYVPLGTQVFQDNDEGELVTDLTENKQRFVLAKGGRGGKGNAFFKTATNQAPRHSQPGEEGEEGRYRLSLKIMADVGLVGLPNAGKSTFIARVSSARPKIADYPFTTLTPNPGVVRLTDFVAAPRQDTHSETMVIADIPGLIPGAHEGKGLGIQFLKHIERTHVLLHLVDVSSLLTEDPVSEALENFQSISQELHHFSEELGQRPSLVVLTKSDAVADEELKRALLKRFKQEGHETFCISSVSGSGLQGLIPRLFDLVREARNQQLEDTPQQAANS